VIGIGSVECLPSSCHLNDVLEIHDNIIKKLRMTLNKQCMFPTTENIISTPEIMVVTLLRGHLQNLYNVPHKKLIDSCFHMNIERRIERMEVF